MTNLELARRICADLEADPELISFVEDRPGHDLALRASWDRLRELGWRPATPFSDGLAITLAWYREHSGLGGRDALGRDARVIRVRR